MTAIEVFQFPATGQQIRTLIRDGEPIFCVSDVCRGLQHSNPSVALNLVDEDDRVKVDLRETDSPNLNRTSINPDMWFVTESGFYALALESKAPGAKAFRRWITHEVLPAIRKTGRYEVARLGDPLDEIEQANDRTSRAVAIARDERRKREAAEATVATLVPKAEAFEAIEGNPGLCPREFHKKYFSAVPERVFFEHLYAKKYLIDQRGKGSWNERDQEFRNGSQHRHPGAKGKPYFYLHTHVDRFKVRRQNTHVLPGYPELALKDRLVRDGLPSNDTPPIPGT